MATNTGRMMPHWLDHAAIPTNDVDVFAKWAVRALGVRPGGYLGVSTVERQKNVPIHIFMAIDDGDRAGEEMGGDLDSILSHQHIGPFLVPEIMPEMTAPLGKGTPRYGFYICAEDINRHMARLHEIDHEARNPKTANPNQNGAGVARSLPYSDPIRASFAGEEGTVIYFQDPDGSQWEFWAPDEMPKGAMSDRTKLGVGRLASATYGSRDLQKTADFMAEFCGLEAAKVGAGDGDTLVLPLAAGPRIVYQRVTEADQRCKAGTGIGLHVSLTVHADDLIPLYEKMWDKLPEWVGSGSNGDEPPPFRTEMHGSLVGRRLKKMLGRGDYFLDGEGHIFHFHGTFSKTEDGSLPEYETKLDSTYLYEIAEA